MKYGKQLNLGNKQSEKTFRYKHSIEFTGELIVMLESHPSSLHIHFLKSSTTNQAISTTEFNDLLHFSKLDLKSIYEAQHHH